MPVRNRRAAEAHFNVFGNGGVTNSNATGVVLGTLVVRFLSLVLGVGVGLVLVRSLSAEQYGEFAFATSSVIAVSALFTRGLGLLLHRESARVMADGQEMSDLLSATLGKFVTRTLIGCVALGIAGFVANGVGQLPTTSSIHILALCGAMAAVAIVQFVGFIELGRARSLRALFPFNVLQPAILLAAALTLAAGDLSLTLAAFVLSYVIAAIVAVFARSFPLPTSLDGSQWSRYAGPHRHLVALAVSQLVLGEADVVIAGLVLGEIELAQFAVLRRLAGLVAVGFGTVNATLAWKIGRTYSQGNPLAMLQADVRSIARWGAVVSIPPAIAIIVLDGPILGYLGPEYRSVSTGLLVMMLAQLFGVIAGPNIQTLLMCGEERFASRIDAVGAAFKVVLLPVLALSNGVLGAAVASATITVLQNLAASASVRKQLSVSSWLA